MRTKILVLLAFIATGIQAQNVQVMYDFGETRQNVTSTIEMFKPDKLGSTFFFVDMEFANEGQPSSAYMEISRTFKIKKTAFSLHAEYNGGLIHTEYFGTPINNAYLAGLDYGWNSKDFTKFLNFKVLYKSIQGIDQNTFQLTGVWNLNYLDNKLTVSGFADYWKENANYIFLTEPQFWYNTTKNLSLGGEIEISHNFGGNKGFSINPAFGIKYTL